MLSFLWATVNRKSSFQIKRDDVFNERIFAVIPVTIKEELFQYVLISLFVLRKSLKFERYLGFVEVQMAAGEKRSRNLTGEGPLFSPPPGVSRQMLLL